MSEGGSRQLRLYRIARRDGADRTEACAASGICEAEARLIDAEDAKNPPSEACYVMIGWTIEKALGCLIGTPLGMHIVAQVMESRRMS